MAPVSHENVRRLDVAVHDALSMSGVQGVSHFNAKPQKFFEFHLSLANHVLQRLPRRALLNDEEAGLVTAKLVEGAYDGMTQRRGCSLYRDEASQSLLNQL